MNLYTGTEKCSVSTINWIKINKININGTFAMINISWEQYEYCLCPLYAAARKRGGGEKRDANPSTCRYFHSKSGATVKLFQAYLHCNSMYCRCLFSPRYKCMYKGKQIKWWKEKKIKTAAHLINATKQRSTSWKLCNINFINKQYTAKQTEPSPIVTARSCFIKLQWHCNACQLILMVSCLV